METFEKDPDPDTASGPCGSQDPQTSVEVKEQVKGSKNHSQEQEEEKEEAGENMVTAERVIKLQREWQATVSLIQDIDVRESLQRAELEEAHRLRCQQVALDAKNCQEKFEEISRAWEITKQMVIPQDLQEALNKQEELCSAIIEDKRKLINELQQELKAADDRYMKDLRRQAQEVHLLMEKMEDQVKVLTKAYEEELTQLERVYQQECEVLLTRHSSQWADNMLRLLEAELADLTRRNKIMGDYEKELCSLVDEGHKYTSGIQTDLVTSYQEAQKELRYTMNAKQPLDLKVTRQKELVEDNKIRLTQMSRRIKRLWNNFTELKDTYAKQKDYFKKKDKHLSSQYKQTIDLCERLQKKIKYFAVTDAKKFKEMWLMIEAEVKQLVERVLDIDSVICRQLLGLEWERPHMPFMEVTGPIQTETQSDPIALELQSGEGEKLPIEVLHKVMALLYDEAGHLIEQVVLDLLTPLNKTITDLCSLFLSLGIEEDDFPKLVHFLLMSNHEQRKQMEDGSSSSTSEVETRSELLDPNCIMPALERFLQQLRREKLGKKPVVVVRDSSGDEAYWQSMANIIPEEKLKQWDEAESGLKLYHEVLTEISELLPETQKLEQQNTELRQLLQQILYSPASTEMEMPQ